MKHDSPIDRLAPELNEVLDAGERSDLDTAIEQGDPSLIHALQTWAAASDQISLELSAAMPLRDLLVHYALADSPSVLTLDEAQKLSSSIDEIEAAIQRHPSLEAELSRIRADRDAFEALWDDREPEAVNGASNLRDESRPARAADRLPTKRSTRWAWRGAAAVAIMLFVLAAALLLQRDAGFVEVRAAAGESERVELGDGSSILLASGSTVRYRLDAVDRRVRLAGQAVFDVRQDDRQFVVETEAATVTVVGTTFGVIAEPTETLVTLAEGTVELASRVDPSQTVRVEAGQQSRVPAGGVPEAPSAVNLSEELAWSGMWYFRAETLGRIAQIVGDHHGVSVEVPEPLAGERVTGAFDREQPVEQTLQTLASALGTSVGRGSDGGYRFEASGE